MSLPMKWICSDVGIGEERLDSPRRAWRRGSPARPGSRSARPARRRSTCPGRRGSRCRSTGRPGRCPSPTGRRCRRRPGRTTPSPCSPPRAAACRPASTASRNATQRGSDSRKKKCSLLRNSGDRPGQRRIRVLQVGRRVDRAAGLAGVAVLVGGAAPGTLALDVAVRQEHRLHRVEELLHLADVDQPGVGQREVDRLRQRVCSPACRSSASCRRRCRSRRGTPAGRTRYPPRTPAA